MKKIFITGAAGLIGLNLTKKLLDLGFFVYGLDNFNDSHYETQKRSEIRDITRKFKKFKFIEKDKREENLLAEFDHTKVDYVVDLASKDYYYTEEDRRDYRKFLDVNVTGTANIFEIAHKLKAKKFIYGSTHGIYGKTKKKKLTEKKIVPKPVSPHGSSKLAAEKAVEFMSDYYKLPALSYRFFSVYGPYLQPHSALNHYIERFYRKKDLEVYVDLSKRYRDYIYVDDAVNYIIAGLDTRLKYQSINIATGVSHNLKEVALNVAQIMGMDKKEVEIKKLKRNLENTTVEETHADISRAVKLLNYKPQIDLDRGLRETINWYIQTKQYQRKYFD